MVVDSRFDTVTVGLNSPWGGGKSTALNLIASELRVRDDVIVVVIDPWEFVDSDDPRGTLITRVLEGIAAELGARQPLFTQLTADETAPVWARRAVKFIHRHTRKRGQPPTFREVFAELAAHDHDAAEHQEAWSSASVRYLTMVHWRRRGWIRFRRAPRTLRSGPAASELFTPPRATPSQRNSF